MEDGNNPLNLTRRDFLGKLAWGSFWTAIAAAVLGMIRLPKPSVMPEVSSRIKLGSPRDFPPGSVRKFDDKNVFAFGDEKGVYAISAVCTHLGCIVSRTREGTFDCPCHGSKFDENGLVIAGPAPRGLEWIEIRRAPNGFLYADAAKTVPAGHRWRG